MANYKKAEYMVVTNDAFELPVLVGTSDEAAAFLGIKRTSLFEIRSMLASGKIDGSKSKYKVIKIDGMEE